MINLNIALNILGGAEYLILILIIAVLAIPFLYLGTLFNTIKLTNPNKRTISPGSVWLALIPIVGIFIHYNHINRINETLEEEFKDKGIKQHDSQFGLIAGKTFSLIGILLFFANIFYYWVTIDNINNRSYNGYSNWNEEYAQFLNSSETKQFGLIYLALSIISLICWIIYWSKISNCKRILLNHNSQMYQNKNSYSQNEANVLAASNQLLNNTSNNYQNKQSFNQTKKCPDCTTDAAINDNFCMKCGFDYTKLPPVQITKLNENEKECPECKLILNKDASNCTNCGFPFSVNEISTHNSFAQNESNVLDATVELNEVESNIVQEPITENIKTPPPMVASVKIQDNQITNETKSTIEVEKNSNKIYYIVFGILLLVMGFFVWYKNVYTEHTLEQRTIQAFRDKLTADSIAAAMEASLASVMEADAAKLAAQEAAASEIANATVKKDEIATKIYKYYEDIQLDRINALDYFAPNVSQYISKKNITPNDINNSIAIDKQEFTKPEIIFDVNNIVVNRVENNITYYSFWIHFKCFRTSKQKIQECDVNVEIGVNQSNEFVSLKETKIENLTFYVGDMSSNSASTINKEINYVSYNFDGNGISEYLNCTFDSKNYPEKIIYSTSKGKTNELAIISSSYNTCKVKFPNSNEIFNLLFTGNQVKCVFSDGKEQYFSRQ